MFALSIRMANPQIGEVPRRADEDIVSTEATKAWSYIAENLCHHLSNLCRIYNDYGSSSRDQDKGNLNSINFPEFGFSFITQEPRNDSKGAHMSAKDELMSIADHSGV